MPPPAWAGAPSRYPQFKPDKAMKNLDQIRAAAALPEAEKLDRSAIAKLPSLIVANGLLAAAAFCNAEGGGGSRPDLKNAMIAITKHLASRRIVDEGTKDVAALIADLSAKEAIDLQRATTEALAYLAFLKRFARKREG